MIKYIYGFALFLCFCIVGFQEIAAQNTIFHPHQGDTILVGFEKAYPPYCIVDEHGNPDGFGKDLIEAVAEVTGLKLKYEIGYWDSLRRLLINKNIDLIPVVGHSTVRNEVFDFTFPYISKIGVLVVRNDQYDIQSVKDLDEKRVYAMHEANAHEYLIHNDFGCEVFTCPTMEMALDELVRGNADAVVIEKFPASKLLLQEKFATLRMIAKPLEGYFGKYAMAVAEGDKVLLSRLNEGLAEVMSNGTYYRIRSKWFSPAYDEVLKDSRIIVAGDFRYPPYDFLDENGQPSGFNTALTKAMAEKMQVDLKVHLMPWKEARQKLKRGEVDIVQGMFYSVERDADFDFSPAFAQISHNIVTRKNDFNPNSLADLKNKSIVVQEGDIMHDLAIQKGLEQNLILVQAQDSTISLVSDGKADCALVAQMQAVYWMETLGITNLKVSEESIISPDYCYAVAKDNQELLALVSEGVSMLKTTGEIYTIHNEWLSKYSSQHYSRKYIIRILILIIIPLAFILLLFFVWNYALRRSVLRKTLDLRKEVMKHKETKISLEKRNNEIKKQNIELISLNLELKESEEKFRNLADTTPVAILLFQDNKFIYFNDAASEISAYSLSELKNKDFWFLIHPDDVATVKSRGLKRQSGKKTIDRYEFRLVTKNGEIKWIDLSGTTTMFNGKPAALVTVVDISLRKIAEDKLKESLKQIERITFNSPSIVWMLELDKDDHIVDSFFSNVVDEYMGLPSGTINNKWERFIACVHPDYRVMLWQNILDSVRNPDSTFSKDFKVIKHNQEEAWYSTKGRSYVSDRIQVYGYVVDVTDRVLSNAKLENINTDLENAKEIAEESNRLKTAFLLNISHEIRTPMNAIKGFGELLHDNLVEEENRRFASIIQSNADQLLSVIDDVLLISRLQSESLKVREEEIIIKDLFNDLVTTSSQLIQRNRQISLKSRIPEMLLDCNVFIDAEKLKRILSELITNAIKYTASGEVILAVEEIRPNRLKFSVKDTGAGISEKDQKKIYDRFFRSPEAQRKAIRGTGLGLSIVRYLVELLGGELMLKSELGQGSLFYFELDVMCQINATTVEETIDEYTLWSDKKILVVEDEEDNYILFDVLLSDKVERLDHAPDGKSAIEALSTKTYDLVLLDIKLPDISGFEVLTHLKRVSPQLPVIAQSAYAMPEDRVKAMEQGCVAYITKPILKEELFEVINQWLS